MKVSITNGENNDRDCSKEESVEFMESEKFATPFDSPMANNNNNEGKKMEMGFFSVPQKIES